ncbi:hypothetical protein C2L61_28955 (plasmid) [Klebsiella pneumoniae]|nr:hypothetical protein C2L61_28955 [Klebsiella pneumoniae]
MTVSFSYEGDQMPDHFFSGTSFFLTANVPLIYRDNNWLIAEEGIEIISSDSMQILTATGTTLQIADKKCALVLTKAPST